MYLDGSLSPRGPRGPVAKLHWNWPRRTPGGLEWLEWKRNGRDPEGDKMISPKSSPTDGFQILFFTIQNLRRSTKVYEGLRRSTKVYEGLRRSTVPSTKIYEHLRSCDMGYMWCIACGLKGRKVATGTGLSGWPRVSIGPFNCNTRWKNKNWICLYYYYHK